MSGAQRSRKVRGCFSVPAQTHHGILSGLTVILQELPRCILDMSSVITMRRFAARRRMLRLVVGALLCSGSLCLGQNPSSPACLSYEPAVVKVTGTLTRKTFPGPPNYESVRMGDRAETYWFVELRSPVCVLEDKADPDLNPSQDQVREIQLVLESAMYKTYSGLIGRHVVTQGTLFGAHTGHHHTPVLLTVKSIESADR